ncbi:hypothetical protein D9M68_971900 [compost metagenome]
MAAGRANSGRNAAISDSPQAKNTLETMTSSMPSTTAPGPTRASAAVASTQPTVVSNNKRFLAACRSAHAPSAGIVNMTTACDALKAKVQANVAQSAPPATEPTK